MSQESPFLRLPPEIRLLIYDYIYEPHEEGLFVEANLRIWGPYPVWVHHFDMEDGILYQGNTPTRRTFSGMLFACKTTNAEITDLIYERMLFYIISGDEFTECFSSPDPKRLGPPHELACWKRARRLAIRAPHRHPDHDYSSLKDLLPCGMETLFRCFDSSPRDTVARMYFRVEDKPGNRSALDELDPREWQRLLKTMSSFSRCARFAMEVEYFEPFEERERLLNLVNAAGGSARLVKKEWTPFPCAWYEAGERVVSSETYPESVESDGKGGEERVICWMSDISHLQTQRLQAVERYWRTGEYKIWPDPTGCSC